MPQIQIEEHLETQRIFWILQRIGWGLLGLMMLAAAVGLLGGAGPLQRETTGAGSALEIRHPRIQRMAAGLVMEFRRAAADSTVLEFPGSYFVDHRVDRWTPEPGAARVIGDHVRYDFGSADRIILHATPLSPGRKSVTIREESGASRNIRYLVLP